jgi:ankyrin repeat protein
MMHNKCLSLFFIFSLSLVSAFSAVQQECLKFEPENGFEFDLERWLQKTIKEFGYDFSGHHFYLFDILQPSLMRLPLHRRQMLLHTQNEAGYNYLHQVIMQEADPNKTIMFLRILLGAGADMKKKSKQKENAIRLAHKLKKERVVAFLLAQKNKK